MPEPLPGGSRALLGIVDDGDPLSTNQLVAFELHDPGGLDGDCAVSAFDLALLLGNWGP